MSDYVKVSSNRFYEIKNKIDNNKGLTIRIKDKLGKVINIGTKDATYLMDQVSKNEITYDEAKTILNDKIVRSANIIALEKPSDNRTKLLKIFFALGEVFTGRFNSIKIVDDKYEAVEFGNKADDKQSKL